MDSYGRSDSSTSFDSSQFVEKDTQGPLEVSASGDISFKQNGVKRLKLNTDGGNYIEGPGDVTLSSGEGHITLSTAGQTRVDLQPDGIIDLHPGVYGVHCEGKLLVSEFVQAPEGEFDNLMDRNELADTYVSKAERNWLKTGGTVALGSLDDNELHLRQNGLACFTVPRYVAGNFQINAHRSLYDKQKEEYYVTTSDLAPIQVEPPSDTGYQPVQWYSDYATQYMAFDNETGTVIRNASSTRDSITSMTSFDLRRYNFEIVIKVNAVSGSVIMAGLIENELMIDDFDPTSWFQPNYKQSGSQWGDAFSVIVSNPSSAIRKIALAFSRNDPTFVYDRVSSTISPGGSLKLVIQNSVLTDISTRSSDSAGWVKLDWSLFSNGLDDPKLRVLPSKEYKLALFDGYTAFSSFTATVTYIQTVRDGVNEVGLASQVPSVRRSEFYDKDIGTPYQYYMSKKNRYFEIDTSIYPFNSYEGAAIPYISLWVEPDSGEINDYTLTIKHTGSNNNVSLRTFTTDFFDISDPDFVLRPWCTNVYRVCRSGIEGLTNTAKLVKVSSTANSHSIHYSSITNLSNGSSNTWLVPFSQGADYTAHSTFSGRYLVDHRAVLTRFVIIGDTECANTFKTGNFKVSIYKESVNLHSDNTNINRSLVHEAFVIGTGPYAEGFVPDSKDAVTRVVNNDSLDPDGGPSSKNTLAVINLGSEGHIIDSPCLISVKFSGFAFFDGIGIEYKSYLMFQYI